MIRNTPPREVEIKLIVINTSEGKRVLQVGGPPIDIAQLLSALKEKMTANK